MKKMLKFSVLLLGLALLLGLTGCPMDDDDGGGGGSCHHCCYCCSTSETSTCLSWVPQSVYCTALNQVVDLGLGDYPVLPHFSSWNVLCHF